jgi:hypothetical protein
VKLLIAFTLACVMARGAGIRPYERLWITVRVLGGSQVPARTAAEAERVAGVIFQKAGIAIRWLDCDASRACREPLGEREVWLHVLEQPPARFSADALGYTVVTHETHNAGGYAAVSWLAVRLVTESMDVDPGAVLGATMAHELGHLLLESPGHTLVGVMAARLGPEQSTRAARGELRFSDDQAERIRQEIRGREE